MDYCTLNKIMVLIKFPILIIDELLDELIGATIFSKLDLKSGYHQIKIVNMTSRKWHFKPTKGITSL